MVLKISHWVFMALQTFLQNVAILHKVMNSTYPLLELICQSIAKYLNTFFSGAGKNSYEDY